MLYYYLMGILAIVVLLLFLNLSSSWNSSVLFLRRNIGLVGCRGGGKAVDEAGAAGGATDVAGGGIEGSSGETSPNGLLRPGTSSTPDGDDDDDDDEPEDEPDDEPEEEEDEPDFLLDDDDDDDEEESAVPEDEFDADECRFALFSATIPFSASDLLPLLCGISAPVVFPSSSPVEMAFFSLCLSSLSSSSSCVTAPPWSVYAPPLPTNTHTLILCPPMQTPLIGRRTGD